MKIRYVEEPSKLPRDLICDKQARNLKVQEGYYCWGYKEEKASFLQRHLIYRVHRILARMFSHKYSEEERRLLKEERQYAYYCLPKDAKRRGNVPAEEALFFCRGGIQIQERLRTGFFKQMQGSYLYSKVILLNNTNAGGTFFSNVDGPFPSNSEAQQAFRQNQGGFLLYFSDFNKVSTEKFLRDHPEFRGNNALYRGAICGVLKTEDMQCLRPPYQGKFSREFIHFLETGEELVSIGFRQSYFGVG
ncbi:hypothetical protein [Parachlamydia sp. AcF125]|uniref:hypothetical protein n=1 Tax=Parachlamydia sp. AcF125 TaxID=2795736 RepID=UPI001BC9ED9D|nr:hypothetical protein [Parachlamydia sp. AcF125]MBS4168256.1 hypothetical protein [Parachlamydia sp. AcF125]